MSGSTVTLLAAGTCTISADQVGNTNMSAAPQVARSFSVAAAVDSLLLYLPLVMR